MKPLETQTVRATRAAASTMVDSRQSTIERVAAGLLSAVIVCRLLTPTDAVMIGETLWIAQLSLLAVLVWVFAVWRAERLSLSFDWLDVSALLLCLGHVTGSLVVIATIGDKRAAMTMLWEWVGLLATYFLARRLFTRSANRQSLVLVVGSTAAVLAGLGIWQHYFGFAESRREYEGLKARLEALERKGRPADPQAALDWDRSMAGIRSDFVQMNIPGDEPARMMWEQRLYSVEPIGLFALTNTLAGVLLVGLIVWLGGLVGQGQVLNRPAAVGGVLITLVITYCLLLTKSRTAWVALATGLAAWAISWRLTWGKSSGLKRKFAAGIAVVGLLLGLAYASGGLDRLVLSESLKSLRYRMEYWTATWRMLLKTPQNLLLGVGPGNFRQNYLEFKLPQSSEEIADPHNLVLDVWANGGLIGLAGLAGVCCFGVRPMGGPSAMEPRQEAASGSRSGGLQAEARTAVWTDGMTLGGAFGFVVVLSLGMSDSATLMFLLPTWLLMVLVGRPIFSGGFPRGVAAIACLALIVHLSGAGGIGMPGVAQLLLLFAGLAAPAQSLMPCSPGNSRPDRPGALNLAVDWHLQTESKTPVVAMGVAGIALYLACWFTGLMPVVTGRSLLESAKVALFDLGKPSQAERDFRLAAEFDPWSSTACERLAEMAVQRWLGTDEGRDDDFERCVKWQSLAIARDPRNPGGHRVLGEMYLAKAVRSGDPADAADAADAFQKAVNLYPNRALGQSQLAESLWRTGHNSQARTAAGRALELDQVNQAARHTDKLLPENRRKLMSEILFPDSN